MKDAFGGSFMLKILLIFFVVFICFMTVAITFAKSFRIKNTVINYLERSDFSKVEDVVGEIDLYLNEVAYSYANDTNVQNHCYSQGDRKDVYLTDNGVCIISKDDGSYYRVFVYIVMKFPLFDSGTIIPISGETKIINY